MNNLMNFEGNNVEVININGKLYFNPYHVGKCLELGESAIKMAISKMNKNQVIKLTNSKVINIDFRKLHNTGENFLTESGVYKLAFKSRKPSAERFADWVADEVLPSINHTGTYTIEDTNQIYYYKGVKCITAKKFYNMMNIEDNSMVQYWLNNSRDLIENKDYMLLTGDDLTAFKKAYNLSNMISSLFIIFKKGVGKLMKLLKLDTPENKKIAIDYFKDDVVIEEPKKITDRDKLIDEIWDDVKFISGNLNMIMSISTLNNEGLDRHRKDLAVIERATICLREEILQLKNEY